MLMDKLFYVLEQLTAFLSSFAHADGIPLWLLGLGGLLMLALAWVAVKAMKKRQPRYQPRPFLFTKTEWQFAAPLQMAIGNRYLMMGKVRIADLLAVESHPNIERSEWMRAFSKISSKHIDFVLACPKTGKVACCLELDDPSHNRADRIERDVFVNVAFEQAGVPLLRIPTQRSYDTHELRQQIQRATLL
jgi:hypothetical protein